MVCCKRATSTTIVHTIQLIICILEIHTVNSNPANCHPARDYFTFLEPEQSDNYTTKANKTATLAKMSRTVIKSVLSKWQDEGAGARVRRSIGRPEVKTVINPVH
jgi:hypothetical protein